jgi:hypothetical protein
MSAYRAAGTRPAGPVSEHLGDAEGTEDHGGGLGWDERLFTLNKEGTRHVITIDEGEAGELAINLDLAIHARLYPGKERSLLLHFAGEEKHKLSVAAAHAGKVWAALTRT